MKCSAKFKTVHMSCGVTGVEFLTAASYTLHLALSYTLTCAIHSTLLFCQFIITQPLITISSHLSCELCLFLFSPFLSLCFGFWDHKSLFILLNLNQGLIVRILHQLSSKSSKVDIFFKNFTIKSFFSMIDHP